jgi:hypothetical protein
MGTKLVESAERHHDGDDLMGRCVKGNYAPSFAEPDLMQLPLVRPRPVRARYRIAEAPRPGCGIAGAVIAAEDHSVPVLHRLEAGEDQPIALQSDINRWDVERSALTKPYPLHRQKGILPQFLDMTDFLELCPGNRDDGKLEAIHAKALRSRGGNRPPCVTRPRG